MTNHPAGKHLGVPTMAPAAFVTLHAHKSTDRTCIRVYASDDGSLPRVHLATITTNGDLDIALAAPAARDLAAQLQAAADACAAIDADLAQFRAWLADEEAGA